MPRYFVINAAGAFYRHLPGRIVSWDTIGKANEFQTVQSARYIADAYKGSRVVEMKGKKVVELS